MRFPKQLLPSRPSALSSLAFGLAALGSLAFAPAAPAEVTELPSIQRGTAETVAPWRANSILGTRQGIRLSPAKTGAAAALAAAGPAPAEIVELARGLRNDPDLIYEYVHDTIRYTPVFGLRKGPMGTAVDREGNSFDQAALMVALLREAGHTASFVYGTIRLDAAQLADWLGLPDNAEVAEGLFGAAGIPATVVASGSAISYVDKSHVWVKVSIDGSDYVFDPAFASYTRNDAIDLPTVMGYDAATFFNGALSGATVTADSVKDLNHANIEGALETYATSLVSHIRSNDPGATLGDIIGGAEVQPVGTVLRQSSLPYQQSVTAEWTDIPDSYRVSLRVQFGVIDQSFFVDEIYGTRLTLDFAERDGLSDPVPALTLGGTQLQKGLEVPLGDSEDLTLTIDNPYAADGGTYADKVITRSLESSFTALYHLTVAMSRPSQEMVQKHQRLLELARTTDVTGLSEASKGETYATMGFNLLAQLGEAQELADRVNDIETVYHNLVSIVGSGGEFFVDSASAFISSISLAGQLVEAEGASRNFSGIFNVFEALTIEQTQDVEAATAQNYLYKESESGREVYSANAATWPSLKPQLVNYSAAAFALIESYLNDGYGVIVPKDGSRPLGSFSGVGFYAIKDGAVTPVLFSSRGTYKGAAATGAVADEALADGTKDNTRPTDPQTLQSSVDLATGAFRMSREDYSVGSAGFPYGLNFQRSYDSADWWREGPLGRGWTHNYEIWIDHVENSSGFQALGQDSPIDAAAAIAALLVAHDLLAAGDSVERMTISTVIHEWLFERLHDNIVVVNLPGPDMVFTKLADGSLNPPPGQVATLVEQTGGDYVLTLKDQTKLTFEEAASVYFDKPIQRLVTWENPNGFKVSLFYGAGRLSYVENDHGWRLDFDYTTGDRLREVNDGTNRDVRYSYSSGELAQVRDTKSQRYNYDYDSVLRGHLTEAELPTDGVNPALRNTYDAFGRVKEQRSARDHVWQYFYGGERAAKADPLGNETVVYFDERRLPEETIDALGNVTRQSFDGQLRLKRTVLPEGNSLVYEHDANHNVTKITAKPKPGSPLADIVRSFVYDQTWNKPEQATDALNRVTDFILDSADGNLLEVRGPQVGGIRSITLYSYNADGQVETVTDPTGKVTRNQYSVASPPLGRAGQLTSVIEDFGGLDLEATFGYDSVGNLTRITDPRLNSSFAEYDDERRLTETYGPSQISVQTRTNFRYDDSGRLEQERRHIDDSGFNYQRTIHTYDAAGNRKTTEVPGNHTTTFDYDELDRLEKTTDPEGRIVETVYDELGRVARVVETLDPVAGVTQDRVTYTYRPNGQLETLTDAEDNPTTYLYDGFDRLKRTTFPDGTYEELTYDANGNIKTRRTRAGELFSYDYDELNRLNREDVPYSTTDITFGYDLAGRLQTVTDETGSISQVYDTAGRLETVTRPDGKTLTYGYDAASNRTRLTWPDDWYVTYDYDGLDRITHIRENGSELLARYDYDFLSRRTRITYGNDTTADFDFVENDNDLRGIDHAFGSSTLAFDYTYNQNDERDGQTVSDDLYLWRPAGAESESYTPNNLNQYSQIGGVARVHDDNGNLTDDGTNSFTFDAKNRLVTAVNPQHTSSYLYDALDRRVAKTVDTLTTEFLLDGAMEVAEYDGPTDALLKRYVYGPGMTAPVVEVTAAGNRRYLHSDAIGSVVAVSGYGGPGSLADPQVLGPATGIPQTDDDVTVPGLSVPAGNDRVLLVAVNSENATLNGASFGASAMTEVGRVTNGANVVALFELREAALGSGPQIADLLVDLANASGGATQITAWTLTGIDQTIAAVTAQASNAGTAETTLSAGVSTTAESSIIVSAFGLGDGLGWSPAAGETEIGYTTSGAEAAGGASYELAVAGSHDLSWSGPAAARPTLLLAAYQAAPAPAGATLLVQNAQTGVGSLAGYSVPAGDNRALMVGVNNSDSQPVPTVSFDGTALTQVETVTLVGRRTTLFHLPEAAIGAGARTGSITVSDGAAELLAFVASNLDQSRLAEATTTDTAVFTSSLVGSITTPAADAAVISLFGTSGTAVWSASGAGETLIAYGASSAAVGASYEEAASAGSVTLSWSGTSLFQSGMMVLASYGLTASGGGLVTPAVESPQTAEKSGGTTLALNNFTVPAGDDRVLLAAVASEDGSLGGVTFDGTPLSPVGSLLNGLNRVALYELREAGIGSGARTGDLVVQVSGAAQGGQAAQVTAFTLTGVEQSVSPTLAQASSAGASETSLTANLSSVADKAILISAFGLGAETGWSPGAGESQVGYALSGGSAGGASSKVIAFGAQDMTWSGPAAARPTLLLAAYPAAPAGSANPGNVVERHAYGPFGEGSGDGAGTIAFRYAGQRYDPETGLYYMRARYYSVSAGRFLSPDPIGYDDGPNIYAYVANDPINFIDPMGWEAVLSPLEQGILEGVIITLGNDVLGTLTMANPVMGLLDQVGIVEIPDFQALFSEPTSGEQELGRILGETGVFAGEVIIGGAAAIRSISKYASKKATEAFAMGIDAYLDDFAKQFGASTWKQFDDVINWKPQVLEKLSDPGQRVLFNLEGVDVWPGVQRAASGRGGATDWELLQIKQNPDFPNLEFYKGGIRVENPFE